jgi:hypothetical protein
MSRMFAVGATMSAATAFRVGVGSLKLWSDHAPRLLHLWLAAGEEDEQKAKRAEKELRQELFATAREATKSVNAELLRGIDHVDHFTKRK